MVMNQCMQCQISSDYDIDPKRCCITLDNLCDTDVLHWMNLSFIKETNGCSG